MPINPLQLPTWQNTPQPDWSRLDKIGDAIMAARQQQAEAQAFGDLVTEIAKSRQEPPVADRPLVPQPPAPMGPAPIASPGPSAPSPAGVVAQRFASVEGPKDPALEFELRRQGIGRVEAGIPEPQTGLPDPSVPIVPKPVPTTREPPPAPVAQAAPPAPVADTAQAQSRGMSEGMANRIKVLFAVGSPKATEAAMGLLNKYMETDKYGFQVLPDGTVIRTDPKTGTAQPIFQSNKPTLHEIGADANGNKVFGIVDLASGKIKPITAENVPGLGGATANPQVTGDEFLKTLDPGRANIIKAIVEGRQQPPGGFALKSPQVQAWIRDAAQYEPGFDLTKWSQRVATAKDFGSGGKSAQNVTSFNTTIQHGERLYDRIDKLGNFETMPGLLNTPYNWARRNISPEYQKEIAAFEADKEAFTRELTRAFRGTGGNVIDIIGWEKRFSAADSPVSLKSAVKEAMELLAGRVEAVGDAYNRGMNTKKEPASLLSPKAQAGMKKIMGEAEPAAATPAKPETAAPVQGAKQAPDGNWYVPDPRRPGKFLMVK